jgi:hypothetical protein
VTTSTHSWLPPVSAPRSSAPRPVVAAPAVELPRDLGRQAYERRFGALAVPTEAQLTGRYRAQLLGPTWLKLLALRSLGAAGLHKAWGLALSGFGDAQHLLGRGGKGQGGPLSLGLGNSAVDGRLCAVLKRDDEAGSREKRRVSYELRVAGDGCLLGMAFIDAPFVRKLGFPFVLVRQA